MRVLASMWALLAALATAARADAGDLALARIGEGAPIYVAARPVALVGALERLGVGELREVKLMRRLSGIDPFDPSVLAAPGIDIAAPLWLSFEPAGLDYEHVRVAFALADSAAFANFLDGVAASRRIELERVAESSALGRQNVVAVAKMASYLGLVVRKKGDVVVIDVMLAPAGKKAPQAGELARRYPWTPLKAFVPARGARRLFVPGAAMVFYVDGRRLYPLLATTERERSRNKACAVWSRAPATFDDVALAVAATPEGTALNLAWGTQAGAPLGGLKFAPVDDVGGDAEVYARTAALSVAFYAASTAPFLALRRSAPFVSEETLDKAINDCGALGALVAVRSWPLALAAVVAGLRSPELEGATRLLRNVALALRDVNDAGPRFAGHATFGRDARATVERLLPMLSRRSVAALDPGDQGPLGVTFAESRESFDWARSVGAAAAGKRDPLPLADVAADMTELGKVLSRLGLNPQLADLIARLRRVDGDVVADGDLLRLSLRSPLKQ